MCLSITVQLLIGNILSLHTLMPHTRMKSILFLQVLCQVHAPTQVRGDVQIESLVRSVQRSSASNYPIHKGVLLEFWSCTAGDDDDLKVY